MSIQPQGDDIKKAVQWLSDEKKHNKAKSIGKLVDEACIKFNLSPKDCDFLARFANDNTLDNTLSDLKS